MIQMLREIRYCLQSHIAAIRASADKPLALVSHILGAWLLLTLLNALTLGLLVGIFRGLVSLLAFPARALSCLARLWR